MGIAIVIVSGLVVMTIAAVAGDIIGKAKARSGADPSVVRELKNRIEELERQSQDRDQRILRLEGDVAFTTKLLEGKNGDRA